MIPPPPLIKVASNTRPYSKLGGTTLNGREEGGQYYILQTCDQERFEARKVVFSWECLNIFTTGCSYYYSVVIFHKFLTSVELSKNSSKESRLEKILPSYKHSQLSNHCNVLIHRNYTAFKVSRYTKKKITTYRAEGSCLNTNPKWRPA